MTEHYLSAADVARELGISRSALATYRMPEPDVIVGRSRGWKPQTIAEWQAARPGHGGRPRKTGA
ncbi:hypothetical protein [Bifidobacterium sp. ESL0704]|uniref:helix-turn-helix transcriptional regulator n=1 Tax=Bifidobacterium sp. ESL0704 TaxID=2983219 RepID=UPI0023F73146|nr:hypothetical protein [Bifidobacterium sp. ESL0704]WEV52770.1 hypothetical protein OZX64_07900 [Bifidobacterium sp. ESL0704]